MSKKKYYSRIGPQLIIVGGEGSVVKKGKKAGLLGEGKFEGDFLEISRAPRESQS